MKKIAGILAVAVLVVSLASLAFAAEAKKGTIKAVDTKAGTITFCAEGTTTDVTLKAEGVDLSKVKANTKAEIMVDKDSVKEIKEVKAPRKAPVGC